MQSELLVLASMLTLENVGIKVLGGDINTLAKPKGIQKGSCPSRPKNLQCLKVFTSAEAILVLDSAHSLRGLWVAVDSIANRR